MNAVTALKPAAGALTVAEQNEAIRTALKTSLYPGASDASVDLVLAYCRASGLDPMTKPVHIVPMSVTVGKDERGYAKKETRDVVMPGIGLYRINAARTGEYAGCSEPEFGPTQHLQFKREVWEDGPNGKRVKKLVDGSLPYPEWCKVTVTKIVDGKEREFTAKEYWLENYAEKGDTGGPNSMWEKRPFAQLAKCTEAQALRKAFPQDGRQGRDRRHGHRRAVATGHLQAGGAAALFRRRLRGQPAEVVGHHRQRQEDGRRPDRHAADEGALHRRAAEGDPHPAEG